MMKSSARIWRIRVAALLALVFTFIWPPVHHGSASPDNHAAQAEAHSHHAHIDQNEKHSILNVRMDADCDSLATGCCMTAHCCPGVSVGPHDVSEFFGDDGTTAASTLPGTGIDPGLVLPPPRALTV